jgi:hypothetical protein
MENAPALYVIPAIASLGPRDPLALLLQGSAEASNAEFSRAP